MLAQPKEMLGTYKVARRFPLLELKRRSQQLRAEVITRSGIQCGETLVLTGRFYLLFPRVTMYNFNVVTGALRGSKVTMTKSDVDKFLSTNQK
jgi:hypothetical protein